jgi:mannosyltransferase
MIPEVILGNSNPRFSGVTSTMLQVLPYQQEIISLGVLGKHHLPNNIKTFSFYECARELSKPLPNGNFRIFHARRNNEMLQAVALKCLFRAKIKIAFTATAQRYPSWITRWLISKADGLLTTSKTAAAYLPRSPDRIICHGIDTLRFTPPIKSKEEAWRKLGFPGHYGVGIFGRVRPQKGTDLLIKAMLQVFKENPECGATVVIVGETTSKYESYLESLKNRIRSEGLDQKFVFLGKQEFERIPALFRGMSIVAALSRNEGFGLTVLEAMASGCTVLASDAGAWGEIVQDDFGRLVPRDDLEQTTQSLIELNKLPAEILHNMGKQARLEIEQNYKIEREAQRLVDFYRSLQ